MRTKYIPFKPHESSDSNKVNHVQRNAAEDIADLYRSYLSAKNDVEVHNILIPTKETGLRNQLNTVQDQLNSMATNTSIFSMYSADKIKFPESVAATFRCRHDFMYGEVSLPIADTYVEYHYIDPITGNRNIITDIDTYVKSFITNNRFKPKVNEIYENSPINALNQLSNKIHLVKTIASNSEVLDIDLVYNMDIPDVRLFNTIRVIPVPEQLVSYKSINISGPSKTQAILPDWDGTEHVFLDENDVPLEKARKRIFRFPEEEISSISLVLNTDIYTTSDNVSKQFEIGAQLISLEYNTYMTEGYVGLEVETNGKTAISQIIPVYEGEPNNIEVFVFKNKTDFDENQGYLSNGTAATIQTKPTLTIGTTEKVYILFKLTKHDNSTSPIIKGCLVKWAQ